jgi:hypothetical protein
MSNYYAELEKIASHIKDGPKYGQPDLAIWGGKCAEDDLLTFLNEWQLKDMPYRIWEYVSEIEFSPQTTNQPPKNVSLLEHGRMFGPGGDLTLRRDGAEFRWHFVGQKKQPEPPTSGNPKDFWAVEQNKQLTFHRWTDKALLWGKHIGNGRWHDDRVARATLEYPTDDQAWERVMIEYDTFSQAGQMQFVWLRELVEWQKEMQDGNRND